MKKYLLVKLLLVVYSLFINLHGAEKKAAEKVKVACVGDSITYGYGLGKNRDKDSYPAQLSAILGNHYDVQNFGVSGSTLINRVPGSYRKQSSYKLSLSFKPDIVIIMLGTNDSKPDVWVHKKDFIKDYVSLIKSYRELPSSPQIWICYPVPAYPGKWGISDLVINKEIKPMIDKASIQTKTKIIDLYKALSNKKILFPDSVHPNAKGAKVIAKTISKELKK